MPTRVSPAANAYDIAINSHFRAASTFSDNKFELRIVFSNFVKPGLAGQQKL
jgi:hypothetical protein